MAEVTTAVRESGLGLSVQDQGATKSYSFADLVADSIVRDPTLPRMVSNTIAQSGGVRVNWASADNSISGVSKLKFSIFLQDLATSDTGSGSAYDTCKQSLKNTFSGYWSGAVTTNPLTGGSRRMIDWIITYYGVGAAAANVTATAAGFVSSISAEKSVNGFRVVDVEVDIVEEWVEA